MKLDRPSSHLSLLFLVLLTPLCGSAENRPNILWICTNQQRFDTIRSMGNPHILTPNLDQLVASGVGFTHAYCQAVTCTPSRASFLTGMYPDAIRACMNGNDHWAEAAPLITKTLADAGYDCGLTGKLHLSSTAGRTEKRPDDGYRFFKFSHDPHDRKEGNDYTDWLRSQGTSRTRLLEEHGGALPPEFHQTTWCTDRALEFVQQKHDSPWLLSLNIFAPHSLGGRMYPPEGYTQRFDLESLPGPWFRDSDLSAQDHLAEVDFQTRPRKYGKQESQLYQAKYWAMIEHIDEQVGRLLAALEETGQRKNTIIIFTSDHGESLGDHGLRRKGCRFYEGLVRVPLIISWPTRYRKGLKSHALVELTDLVPTLLEATGLRVSPTLQGKSLASILEGRSDPHRHRNFVRCIYYRALTGKSYGSMIRTRHHKLVIYHGHELGELFDLRKDPHEHENLWENPAYAPLRFELMKTAFDAAAFATDLGPRRVGGH